MDSLMSSYQATPPIARNLATATFLISLACHIGAASMEWFMWSESRLWRLPPEIWRLATGFMITHPGLALLFQTYFLYSNLSQMEVGNPRFSRKEDVVWYLMFVTGLLLIAFHFTGYGYGPFLLPAPLMALCYTVTQDQRGMKASMYFITIPAQLTPYFMLFITFLVAGKHEVILELHGLVAAHFYDYLTRIVPEFGGGRNIIPTPAFLSRLIRTPVSQQRSYGTAFRARDSDYGRSSGAERERGPLPDSWETRGRGHRLG